MASPEEGYRMRARLHAKEGRSGSSARDPTRSATRVAPAVVRGHRRLDPARRALAAGRRGGRDREHRDRREHPGNERTPPRSCAAPSIARRGARWPKGSTGLTVAGASDVVTVAGAPVVTDRLAVSAAGDAPLVTLTRHTTAFFQANRFLLPWFVQHVVGLVADGPCSTSTPGWGCSAWRPPPRDGVR
jgi:hypothetical protein